MKAIREKLETVQTDIHRELIEGSKNGNTKAQYRLYTLYSKAMYNICCRIMKNTEEAEDMLQESFTEAFHKLGSFRYESSFGAWIKRIVINRCINEIKKRKTSLSFFEDMHLWENRAEKDTEIDESLLHVDKIKRAMLQLPEGGRIVFSLYLLEGYDHTEISEILNISESTSKTQYMRAKNRVKEILTEQMNQSKTNYYD